MFHSSYRRRGVRRNFQLITVFLALLCHGASFATDVPAIASHDSSGVGTADDYAPSIYSRDTMDSEETDSGSGYMRMIVSLLVVLSLIFAGVFLLKKIGPYSGLIGSQAQAKHSMMVLSRLSLGQRRAICLVRIADEILVIGVTNTNMSLLSKINAEDYYGEDVSAHGTLAKAGSQASKYGGNFKSFRKILEKFGAWNDKTSDAP